MDKRVKINCVEAKSLLLGYKADDKDGTKVFGLTFKRKNKKCLECNKSTAKLNQFDNCPTCGSILSTVRTMGCRFGVTNPTSEPVPNGNGESFEEALENGRIKVFDMNAQGKYGRGGYRQFYWDNILSIRIGGVEYEIKNPLK